MLERLLKLPLDYSVFLFGARGTGKSTLVNERYNTDNSLFINLLDPVEELQLRRHPEELRQVVLGCSTNIKFIIIDEIQKVPKLLDVVHLLIETDKCQQIFILTGSSAKQLKAAGVNLLAGRAFTYYLFPFTAIELNTHFSLEPALLYGMMPKIYSLPCDEYKSRFLQSYAITYLKEEVWSEHLVKNFDHFRLFLEVAAQANGKIINYTNIARDVGIDDKTVKHYFSLLEDTMVGHMLEPFHHSFRKRLRTASKFYFFDIGVARALSGMLSVKIQPSTSYYDELFEQFIIMECIKLKHYYHNEFKLSFLRTASDVEIDLIIERPGQIPLFIEIKSKDAVQASDLSSLLQITKDFGECEAICLSQDPRPKIIEHVSVLPWLVGLKRIFGIEQ